MDLGKFKNPAKLFVSRTCPWDDLVHSPGTTQQNITSYTIYRSHKMLVAQLPSAYLLKNREKISLQYMARANIASNNHKNK